MINCYEMMMNDGIEHIEIEEQYYFNGTWYNTEEGDITNDGL